MVEKMKVGVMEGIKEMSVREINVPSPGPGKVLIKIHHCNICTTDWQTWLGLRKSQGRKFPWACGHEMAGEIVALGEEVRNDLKVGMHVGIGGLKSQGCGQCFYCRIGHPSKCINKPKEIELEGIEGSFGMSQYLVDDASRVYRLSEDLSYEEGAFLEPVATSVHGVKKLRITPQDKVLVIGAGNLGLINAQVARVFGGEVYVSEIDEKRCEIAESMGFTTINPLKNDLQRKIEDITKEKGMDAVILAVGNTTANDQAFQVLGNMGRVLFFAAGYPVPKLNIDSNIIHYKEYELIGSWGSDPSDYEIATNILNNRSVKVDKIISHRIPIDDIQRAFELAATPGNYRVSIYMW